ncbi:protein LAZ1 [Tanacetum coccineum]
MLVRNGNLPSERRHLWSDLGMYKYVVWGFPWVLMGDFNVALNLEDSFSGSLTLNSAMYDFKACVNKIEVMDINATGLHFTWNQKPKGGGGVIKKLDQIIVVSKMKLLKKPLWKLLHDQGNLHERVHKLRLELDEVQKVLDINSADSILREEECVYIQAFNEAKLDEERNQRSRIDSILNTNNVEVSGNLVPDVFVSHYEQFLGSSTNCNILNEEGLFSNKVTADIASNMVCDVTNDEIKAAMFDIGDDRAPGPDGYTFVFFKKGWDIVGDDICNAVHDFFSNGLLLKEINHTFLALIPKVSTPLKVNDYWSISCCNVIYKCISKIITNRIMDGIKSLCITIIEIGVLLNVPLRLTFKRRMIRINGNIHGFFKGNRGLRQGDPLSPYLITLVMEILTLILKRQVRLSESFRYHRYCEEIQLINVCFADDLFIFARGDVESSRASVLIIPKGIIYDIHQLIRGFLWCNGELKRGKAKIAWDDICLPKTEGGLGLRNLKLRGRTFWDVPVKYEMRVGVGVDFLTFFDIMRSFFWVKLGNGDSTSLWYDNWCSSSPLINYLTPRDISREGFLLTNTVEDLVSNGTWSWPQSWLLKAPDLDLITCLALVSSMADLWQWRDRNGNILSFSVAKAWEAIRPLGNQVAWSRIVWFSHNIPRHAFHLWLVMRHGLKTHDKMRQWDVRGDTDLNLLRCALCDNCPDSHTHLFFECTFSAKVWSYVRDLAAYFIWMEQNNRTFKNTRRSPKEIRDLIMVTVRLDAWEVLRRSGYSSKKIQVRVVLFVLPQVKRKVGDWKNKFLSFAGRTQLTRSVLSSIHLYWASVFILPSSLMFELEQIMRGFLWCQGEMKRGKAKVAWDAAFFRSRISNGISTYAWFDTWCSLGHLSSIISNRDIYSAGFHLDAKVCDIIHQGEWAWPANWYDKYPMLANVHVPSITAAADSCYVRNFSNNEVDFSVAEI